MQDAFWTVLVPPPPAAIQDVFSIALVPPPSAAIQDAFWIVLVTVVGIGAVVAVISLLATGKLYDQIGRGGLSINEEGGRDRPVGGAPSGGSPQDSRERDAEIRQLLAARNEHRTRRGEAPLDVEAELRRLTAPAVDPALREEIRQLVVARNERRLRAGQEPLDVEAEVERQVRELG
jgi:hypothetical protein